jgi:hypothetical protein
VEELVEVLLKELVGGLSQGAPGLLGILGLGGQETTRVPGARDAERLCS